MKVLKSENNAFFDIDDTLIMAYDITKHKYETTVEVYDPVEKKFITMVPHLPNIRLLKEEKFRKSYVIVWSRGGFYWAETVVRALGLESYVDIVMSKPLVYFDDKDVSEWLPYRVYLPPDMKYKR